MARHWPEYAMESSARTGRAAVPELQVEGTTAESAYHPFAEELAGFQQAVRGWFARHREPASGIQATWSAR